MHLLTASGAHLEKRMPAPPGSPWGDTTPPVNSMVSPPAAGVSVTEKTSIGIGAVWACVGILSDSVATLPLRQYKGSGVDKKEIALSQVIVDPWPEAGMTNIDFVGAGQVSLALRGNFFGQIVDRDKDLYATAIQPFDPEHVRVRRDRDGQPEYKVNGKVIPADDVFHIRNIMRSGALVGLNPIEELRTTLGLARAAELYGSAFFENSANPSGVIETSEDLEEDETLALARSWMASHQGINKAHLPAVLTGGATWRQVQLKPEDAQFIESRQLSRSEVAQIFRIPPHLIGDVDRTTSWGSGIEQQEIQFVTFTLLGYLRRWETALSNLLPPGQHVAFDLRRRLRGDSVQRSAVIVNLRNAGVINADEARLLYEDLPPIAGGAGETYLVPLNMGDAGAPMAVPTPTGSK